MTRNSGPSLILAAALAVALLAGYLSMRGAPELVDEVAYYPQIVGFTKGDFTLSRQLSPLPGYTGLMAAMAYLFGLSSLPALRLLTVGVSAASLLLFWLLDRSVDGAPSARPTLVYATLPIAAPFFFLLYTDVLSLALVFGALWCLFSGRNVWSGVLAIGSMLVRQNNILWLGFLLGVAYLEGSGWRPTWEGIGRTARRCWMHLVGVALFAVFVILNKGVALHNKDAVPSTHFSVGNLFFALAVVFVLFLPWHLANARRIVALLRRRPLVLLGLTALFALYMAAFRATHPYNLRLYDYFIRNAAIAAMTSTMTVKALAFVPIAWSLLSLAVTPLRRPSLALLYPFSILYLGSAWLIEPRYYLIPVCLFVAFRREQERKGWEWATIALGALLSVALLVATRRGLLFL